MEILFFHQMVAVCLQTMYQIFIAIEPYERTVHTHLNKSSNFHLMKKERKKKRRDKSCKEKIYEIEEISVLIIPVNSSYSNPMANAYTFCAKSV